MKIRLFLSIILILLLAQTILATEPSSIIEGVPTLSQFPELPTGCEATSLTMLLNFYGMDIDKTEVADDMPKGNLPYWENGSLRGNNPHEVFIGSPFDSHSYGIYHEPILNMITDYYGPGSEINLTGMSFDEILQNIDIGNPIMVWVTINMVPMRLTTSWNLPDNTSFQWTGNEHVVIIVGYTENSIIVNDPYIGDEIAYDKKIFEERWNELGNQAIMLNPIPTHSIPPNTP
ncbi:C39 family peptidase [Vallitalea okinawensis]|uniref:C39 family peptidase n=1 Tax=Vallitalea okinawensis TaxID=2078660 RepID=UPI000CFCE395|nr:C39 family peptidase [Vallitalea okinawensis]